MQKIYRNNGFTTLAVKSTRGDNSGRSAIYNVSPVRSTSGTEIDFPFDYVKSNVSRYYLDSEGNTGTTQILEYNLGGLYGMFVSGITNATSGITTGEITTLPLANPVFYSSIVTNSLGDNYGIIWIGYFKPPTTGTYTFYTSSDDGSAVWIGEFALSGSLKSNAVLDNNYGGGQGNTERSATIELTADTYYPIRIVTLEGSGGDNCTFSWAGPGISKTTDLTQYYYYNGDGSDFVATINLGYTATPENVVLSKTNHDLNLHTGISGFAEKRITVFARDARATTSVATPVIATRLVERWS
jgi:hypothetical protein